MTAQPKFALPDGLYRYVFGAVVVGFVVRDGVVVQCAPWLRSRINNPEWRYRMTTARWVCP